MTLKNMIMVLFACCLGALLLSISLFWWKIGRKAEKREESSSQFQLLQLSIHLVIVPFLDYSSSKELIPERLSEYRYVLKKNLLHELIESVHILTTNSTHASLLFEGMPNIGKLNIIQVKSINSARVPWQYISENLVGRHVMFANADVYLGAGFELVDPIVMQRQRIMYSMSRRVAPEERCGTVRTRSDVDRCTEASYKQWKSHDTFLTRLKEPLSEDFLSELEFNLVSPGIENMIIWLFQKKLKYCVLNPCAILEVYHYHCTNLRTSRTSIPRVNLKRSGEAPFVDRLSCY